MPNIHETYYKVSIHTPTQGVTNVDYWSGSGNIVSIHTPTQGVTVDPQMNYLSPIVSIHTPTQGVTIQFAAT